MDSDTAAPPTADAPRKRRAFVRFRGESYALSGVIPEIGSPAPDFLVYSWLNAERVGISLSSFLADGVPVLLSVFASFDSHACIAATTLPSCAPTFGITSLTNQPQNRVPHFANSGAI